MATIKRVVCNKSKTCSPPKVYGVPSYCGGKVPHWPCEECGNCKRDPTAECIEIIEEKKKE
jgi:hypothetical protein